MNLRIGKCVAVLKDQWTVSGLTLIVCSYMSEECFACKKTFPLEVENNIFNCMRCENLYHEDCYARHVKVSLGRYCETCGWVSGLYCGQISFKDSVWILSETIISHTYCHVCNCLVNRQIPAKQAAREKRNRDHRMKLLVKRVLKN